jgi:hypothetical protein
MPRLRHNVEIYDKSDAQGFGSLEGEAGTERDNPSNTS